MELVDQVYTAREVMQMLKIGRSQIYEMLRTGEIKSKKIGRMIRISRRSLEEWLSDSQA